MNYKAIADVAVTYADYQTAFAAMSVETTVGTPRTLTGNDLRVWAAQNNADYTALKNDSSVLSEMAVKLIDSPNSALDMSDTKIQLFVSALTITQSGKDAIVAMAVTTKLVWVGLNIAHIHKALDMRTAGTI